LGILRRTVRPIRPHELAINTASMALHLPTFTRRPWASPDAVRRWQLGKLRALVAHAYEKVGLYREKYRAAGAHPRDIRTLADFARLPTVTKSDVLAAWPDGALARGTDLSRCLVSRSSGSTGEVLSVVHRADRIGIQGLALHRLVSLYTRWMPWERLVYVYTSRYPARSLLGLWPMDFEPTLAPPDDLARSLEALRPAVLACYPSHLRTLAQTLGPRRARGLGLRAVSVSSELSSQRERDALGQVFGCGVWDEYSTEELTRVAAQCRRGTYHLFEDVTFTEVLDPDSDRGLPDGVRGEVVGTYLHNLTMPFIRYRQGDVAAVTPSECPCGRRFRAIRDIEGRRLDRFVLPSGRVLTPGWLLDASYSFLLDVGADIAAFTLVQEATDHVRIEVVPGPRYLPAMSQAIAARFASLAGEPLRVEVEVIPALRRTAAGKHHPIVSRVGRA
jgi:phenylacetate-CoA ligase